MGARRWWMGSLLGLLLFPLLAWPATDTAPPMKLLMVLWRGETAAEQGFLSTLEAAGIPLALERIDGAQNRERLAAHFWAMDEDILNYDAVYAFGTTASVMTHSILRGRVPLFYSMVSDPREAGLVARDEGTLVVGTTDGIAAELKLRPALALFPIRHLGFLFNARERNAQVQLDEMSAFCERLGIRLSILRVAPDANSLDRQLRRLQAGAVDIDTLYLPSDSYIISQSATIMAALANTDYRIIGATETFVRDGALLAVAPDYRALGQRLGERLVTLYRQGAAQVDTRPIGVVEPRVLYNEDTGQRLGIAVPEAMRDTLIPVTKRSGDAPRPAP